MRLTQPPETRYARSGELSIGYQVVGDGPLDLVFVPGLISHIDLVWTFPASRRFFERLASYSRLILYDKRGQGVSDPPQAVPTPEEDMDDLRAVLDAAGSEQAALLALSEGGPMAAMFAATHPERVSHLVLFGSISRGMHHFDETEVEADWQGPARLGSHLEHWGDGRSLELFGPSVATEERIRAFASFERAVGSPGRVRARWMTAHEFDARPVLGALRVPTLVMHRTGDLAIPCALGRELGDAIPGAHFLELPGIDHIPWVGDPDSVLDPIEEFLTGERTFPEADRVLATVLFTDIVDSTRRAAELGDRRWSELSELHDRIVREELERFRGREVKTMGDGFLATFDGPARAIRCASAIVRDVADLGLQVRAGLHTGECEFAGDDVRGLAVAIGARVGALAGDGEVLVSSTVKDLVAGSGIRFEDRGTHALKGVPDKWHLYAADAR